MTMPRRPEPELMDDPAEARAYAAADFAEVNLAFVERLFELAGPLAAARALDLGTGPADIPIRLVRARPDWRVTALDASATMLEIARDTVRRAGFEAAINLLRADAASTRLPERSFDIIFSNSILHHVSDADRLWTEVKRLAGPGALVLMRDLARPPSAAAARRIIDRHAATEPPLLRDEYYRSLLAAYTPDEIRNQLDRAGLTSLDVRMVSDRHLDVFGRPP